MLNKQLKDAIIQDQVETLKNLLMNVDNDAANLILDTGETPLKDGNTV